MCFRKCLPWVSSHCVDLSDSFFGFLSRSTSLEESGARKLWLRCASERVLSDGGKYVRAWHWAGIWCKSVLTTMLPPRTLRSTQIDHLFVFGQILIYCQTLVSFQISNINADRQTLWERDKSHQKVCHHCSQLQSLKSLRYNQWSVLWCVSRIDAGQK